MHVQALPSFCNSPSIPAPSPTHSLTLACTLVHTHTLTHLHMHAHTHKLTHSHMHTHTHTAASSTYADYYGMMGSGYQQSSSGYGPTRGYSDAAYDTERRDRTTSAYHPYRR